MVPPSTFKGYFMSKKNVAVAEQIPAPVLPVGTRREFQFQIEQDILELLRSDPFYGYLLIRGDKVYSDKLPALAGVTIRDRITFMFNPALYISTEKDLRRKILVHECLHLIHEHVDRGQGLDHKLFNIAADAAINQIIPDFPDTGKIAGRDVHFATLNNLQKEVKRKVEPLKSAEYYYDVIKEEQKRRGKGKGEGEGEGSSDGFGETPDDHGDWNNQKDKHSQVQKEIVKNEVRNAYEQHKKIQSMGRQIGNIPAELERMILKLLAAKINWKSQLRNFVANSEEIRLELSRKKRNRRFGMYVPGDKVYSLLKVDLIMDNSGSIGEKEVEQFMSEIHNIHKNNAIIRIIQVDCAVNDISDYNPKKKIKVKGGGGTDLRPAFDVATKGHADCVICLTDGYIPDTVGRIRKPTLWVVTANEQFKAPFGKQIALKIE